MNFMRRRRTEMGNSYDRSVLDGGFDAVFDAPLPEELTCCICFLAFREPMQLACGHQYCRSCLDKYSKKQGREYTCPTDRLQVAANKVFPDKALERRVLSLAVSCGNWDSGCKWSGELRGLEEHTSVCAFTTMECRMCGLQVLETILEDHMANQCGHRVLSCGLCQVDYLFKDEHHHNEMCDRWPVTCTSCNAEVLRGDMDHHLLHRCAPPTSDNESEDTSEECSPEKSVDEVGLHTALARIKILEKQLVIAEEKNSALEKQTAEQEAKLSKHMEEAQQKEMEMKDRMSKMEEELQQVLVTLATITASQQQPNNMTIVNNKTNCQLPVPISFSTSTLDKGQQSARRKPSQQQPNNMTIVNTNCQLPVPISFSTSTLDKGQQSARRKPTAPKYDKPSPCRSVPNLYETGFVEDKLPTNHQDKGYHIPNLYSSDAEETQSHVQQEQPDITDLKEPLGSTSPRSPLSAESCESSSFQEFLRLAEEKSSGVFVWKVSRYIQKLTEARHTHTYIHSSPFFTSERGYKMRLQAWLNGQGMGKNTCISLYAQIMQGPYDDELRWPYRLKTTLSILNQRDGGKHRERTMDVGREVILDEWRFGRPMSEMNEGFGNSTALITHRNALSNGYVEDDCVYFMCKVEPDRTTVSDEPRSHGVSPRRVQQTAAEDTDCCIF